jgi:hypothetical protein
MSAPPWGTATRVAVAAVRDRSVTQVRSIFKCVAAAQARPGAGVSPDLYMPFVGLTVAEFAFGYLLRQDGQRSVKG